MYIYNVIFEGYLRIMGLTKEQKAERRRARQRQHYHKNKQKYAARAKRRRTENRDKFNEHRRRLYAANPEKVLNRIKKWRTKNKQKTNESNKSWYNNNKSAVLNKTKRYRQTHREHVLFHGAKTRAKRKKLEFSISKHDIVIPQMCPILDIPIDITSNKALPNSPSIDRIDNNKGYVPGNIIIVSRRCNAIKSDANTQEIRAVGQFFETLNLDQYITALHNDNMILGVPLEKRQKILWRLKHNAKLRNVPFNLTVEDIIIRKRCPIFDIDFVFASKMQRNSISFDRIIPHHGYVKGNVIAITMRANTIKQDATPKELLQIANRYETLIHTEHRVNSLTFNV